MSDYVSNPQRTQRTRPFGGLPAWMACDGALAGHCRVQGGFGAKHASGVVIPPQDTPPHKAKAP